jgi:thiol-disulfide isomerase/thioredoxin
MSPVPEPVPADEVALLRQRILLNPSRSLARFPATVFSVDRFSRRSLSNGEFHNIGQCAGISGVPSQQIRENARHNCMSRDGMRLVLLFTIVASSGWAQTLSTACEASTESHELIQAWRTVYDDTRLDLQDRLEPLRKAIADHPSDIFLHHSYQDYFDSYMTSVLAGPEISRYREALARNPESELHRYLLGRILWGRSTAEGFALIKGVSERNPNFAWAHLTLARYYEHASLRDAAARDRHLARFRELCPASLDSQPYGRFFFGTQPPAFRASAAAALRARLQDLTTTQALAVYTALWEMEFQRPPAEHGEVRSQITRDLARIRERASYPVYSILLEGYELIEDREGARWVREQILKEAPWSRVAQDTMLRRWYQDRPRPTSDASREKAQGYYRELLAATDVWVKQFPRDPDIWNTRLRSLYELPAEPVSKFVEAAEKYLELSAVNQANSSVVDSIAIAQAWLDRDTLIDRIPALVERFRKDAARRMESDEAQDWTTFLNLRDDTRADVEVGRWRGWALLAAYYARREPDQAAKLRSEIAAALPAAPAEPDALYWASRPYAVDAFIHLGALEQAEKVLTEIEQWTAAHAPAANAGRNQINTYQERQAKCLERRLHLAMARSDKANQLAVLRALIRTRPYWTHLSARFAAIDQARSLWKQLDRPEAEFDAFLDLDGATPRKGELVWSTAERKVPGFSLSDLAGRVWTLADLRGKTTLINFWATWCGPCIAEMPYLEKLHHRFKDQASVQLLTLNVDENPGVVAPFLRTGNYTFPVAPAGQFVQNTLQVNGYPTNWVVDPDGVVRRMHAAGLGEPDRWVEWVYNSLTKPN